MDELGQKRRGISHSDYGGEESYKQYGIQVTGWKKIVKF